MASPSLDARILELVQSAVPLTPRPFAEIGTQLGIDEQQTLERIGYLKHQAGIIRQVSAIFDTQALGYESMLVAGKYRPEALDAAATVIGEHPGVSHSYGRQQEFNLWYTLAVAPTSRLGLEKTVELLHQLSGALATRQLPALKTYKIGVQLDFTKGSPPQAQDKWSTCEQDRRAIARAHPILETDIPMVRALQRDLPLIPRPYDALAEQAGCSTEALLEAARLFLDRGQMRRFSAVLHHREAGFAANVLAVWKVPPDRADEVGRIMAGFRAVSHCYLRKSRPDWPYNVYTMVHGRTREQCVEVLEAIRRAAGMADRRDLWSTKEYKKSRVQYFGPEAEAWEARYAS